MLSIRSDSCELDFLALGALVHRLDPGATPFRQARSFHVHVSGGEYNVAANLAACFGLRTGLATAMVANGIGELIQSAVRQMGVRPLYKWFDTDGVRGPNMATVYSDRGHGIRPPVVFYNRANEAAALLKPGDFDWPNVFGRGVRWFHSGGIFAALSESTSQVLTEALQIARQQGTICSLDLNYRAKLWNSQGGRQRAQRVMSDMVRLVDVLIGNEEDLQQTLGIRDPDVDERQTNLDPDSYFAMIEQLIMEFPNVKLVATTLREVESANRHQWGAMMWMEGQRFVSPMCRLDVLDRIGGGDGFASGLAYGLLSGRAPQETLDLGWAHGALLTTFPGDVTMASLAEVEAFAAGGTARVQR